MSDVARENSDGKTADYSEKWSPPGPALWPAPRWASCPSVASCHPLPRVSNGSH